MYAIVEIAGLQYKVVKDQRLFVHRLEEKEGGKVTFDRVLLTEDNGAVSVGAPAVSGVAVKAKVLQHLKGDKVLVFKKKRRKGYQKLNGHRQYLTEIQIESIGKAATKKAAPAKAEAEEVKAEKPAAKKAASSSTAKEATKKAPAKKAPAKKTASKKAEDDKK
jgi:large subunit ribosomal protein L21